MSISFTRILAQAVKEVDQFRRDRLTLALAFVLPVAALMMYGFATRLEAQDIPVSVINFDSGKVSRGLVDAIFAGRQLVPSNTNTTDVLEPLDFGKSKASILIPPEFSSNVQSGRPADIQVVIDGTDVNNARIIKNAILSTTQFFAQETAKNKVEPIVHTSLRLWFNPGRKEALHIVPGAMALVLWIFPALLSSLTLAREKEQGTILQIYASNLTSLEFISGKAIAYLGVGLIEACLLVMAAVIVFGLRFQANLLPFILSTILYVLSGVLFGLFAGTRAHTQMAAVQIVANLGFLGSMLLSGFIYPIRNIAYPLSLLANVVPSMYYILVTRNEFVRGGPWSSLWYAPVVLLALDVWLLFLCSKMKMKLAV